MRVAVTMSCIAIGIAFGIFDTANATNEGDYQKSSAIEPKIKSDARIMGSDGRARTPTQHAYWVARHPKEQRLPADASVMHQCHSRLRQLKVQGVNIQWA